MRVRLKYGLPLAQMALAVALLWWSNRWLTAAIQINDSPSTAPAFTLLVFINAPAALARALWFRHVDGLWDDVMFVASIGMSWCWVALNINSWQERSTLLLFTWVPLRLAADLLLIALSGCFVWFSRRIDIAHLPWQWLVPTLTSALIWSVGPVFVFGGDLIHCLRHNTLRTASASRR